MSIEPDIAGVIEIENHLTDDALMDLVNGINGIFGTGAYDYISTGTIGTDAIKVAIIYKPEKVTPVGPFKILDSSVDPNFIDTKNRPSLAQTFETMDGSRFTVVVNHLKSKGTNCNDVGDLDTGDGQGNCNLTRTRAANALIEWLSTDPTESGDPDFLLIGDFNSYAKEDPIETLKNAGYVNLVEGAAGSQAYSYAFEGQSGTLDYALVSSNFASQVYQVSELHINADEPTALDYNDYNQALLYAPNMYRYADHDPIMVITSPIQKLVFLPVISR
jgi:predicted extracellular nuclease